MTDFYATVARWIVWASDIVSDWPDDVRQAQYDVASAEAALRQAESIAEMLGEPAG